MYIKHSDKALNAEKAAFEISWAGGLCQAASPAPGIHRESWKQKSQSGPCCDARLTGRGAVSRVWNAWHSSLRVPTGWDVVWISKSNINVYKRGFKLSTTLDFPSFPFTFLPIKKMLFTTWIKVEDRMLSEISQAQKENTVGFHLILEVPREAKFRDGK